MRKYKLAGVSLALATGLSGIATDQVMAESPTVVTEVVVREVSQPVTHPMGVSPTALVLPRHGCAAIACPPHAHYACTNTGATVCHRWQLANFQWVQGPFTLLQQQWGYVAILCTYSSTVKSPQTQTACGLILYPLLRVEVLIVTLRVSILVPELFPGQHKVRLGIRELVQPGKGSNLYRALWGLD